MIPSSSYWLVGALLLGAQASDPLPSGALARWSSPGLREAGPVFTVAFSTDGKYGASGSGDGSVRLWHGIHGNELRVLRGHHDEVKAVAFSAAGKIVASAGADKTIRLWETASGKAAGVLEGHQDAIEALVFAPDGKVLISAGQDNAIIFWDTGTRQAVRRLDVHKRGVRCLAMSRDSKTLASGGEDRMIWLWDFPAGKARLRFTRPGWVFSVAFSPDGLTLASGGRDQLIHVRNLSPGDDFDTFGGYEGPVEAVAVSRDAKMVAAGNDDGKVRLWEIVSRKVRREFSGHKGIVQSIALSPDEKRLLSGGEDGQIFVWDVTGPVPHGAGKKLDPAERLALWREFAGPPEQAFQAMALLRAEPEQFIGFLDLQLEPLFKLTERLTNLVRDLESDRFTVRQQATQELEKIGDLGIPFLEEKLKGKLTLEAQRRLEQVVARVKPREPGGHSTQLQLWRTIEILESLATPPARETLQRMAKDIPDARLRQEAQGALQRLKAVPP